MRIVLLAETLGIGGLPNYVLQLARLLSEWEAQVVVAHMGDSINPKLETAGLDVVRVANVDDLAALQPDLVHVHLLSEPAMLQGLFKLGVPLVRSFHDYTSTCLRRGKRRWPGDRCQRPLGMSCAAFGCIVKPSRTEGKLVEFQDIRGKIAERYLYRRFDALVTGSRHMTGMLQKNGFPTSHIYTVPYFSRFAAEAQTPVAKAPGAGTERPLHMLFSGQAEKGKGLEILIQSLQGLRGLWRLTVFSEGPRLEHAKKLAEETGVASHIDFHGWVAQSALADAYRNADVFVLPSVWDDPGPLVGIEAMSFATPVVGFAVGGIPDYVIDKRTGYLVQKTDAASLHSALQFCLESPVTLHLMGANAQKLIREQHTPQAHMEGISAAYNDILKNRHKTA
jgi:glycosyltransferase involved in cell wall biosynthesis